MHINSKIRKQEKHDITCLTHLSKMHSSDILNESCFLWLLLLHLTNFQINGRYTGNSWWFIWNVWANTSVTYLPNYKNLSDHVLNKHLTYFIQGCIHERKIYKGENHLETCTCCWHSAGKSDILHKYPTGKKITESFCTCNVK